MRVSEPSSDQESVPAKNETETSVNVPPKGKKFCVGLVDNMTDRVVYQEIRNADLSEYGQSNFDDQGITFGPNREVRDEMKRMYQSSLKATSAPGAPPGDEGDDESDHCFNHKPQRGGSDPRQPHKDPHGDNRRGGRNGGGGGGRHTPQINGGPPGPSDDGDEGDGDDKSEGGSHHSQHSNNHRTSPN